MGRSRALITVVLLAIGLNTYAAIVLWTFDSGERDRVVITECTGHRSRACFGLRHGDGAQVTVVGARGADPSGSVPVRMGPLGTYADRSDVLVLRLVPAGVVDVGLLVGFSVVQLMSLRMRASTTALRTTPGAALLVRSDRRLLSDPGGAPLMEVGPSGAVVSVRGEVVCRLVPIGAPDDTSGLTVSDPEGRVLGSVHRDVTADGATTTICDDQGRPRATVRRRDQQFAVTDVTSAGTPVGGAGSDPLARIGWERGDRWWLRVDRPLGEPLTTLLIVVTLHMSWLSGVQSAWRLPPVIARLQHRLGDKPATSAGRTTSRPPLS